MDNNCLTSSSTCQNQTHQSWRSTQNYHTTGTHIYILWLQPACSATSQQFHLSPCYESHNITINISLNTANLNVVNTLVPEFKMWQHLEDHLKWDLTSSLGQIYLQCPLTSSTSRWLTVMDPVNPFLSTDESIGETVSVWTLFSHSRSLCNGYRITHTSRIRDILLVLLVPLRGSDTAFFCSDCPAPVIHWRRNIYSVASWPHWAVPSM